MDKNRYQSPLSDRYRTKEMSFIFSQENKFRTWRSLWIALAKAQKKLGLPIRQDQIDELELYKDQIPFEEAEKIESEIHHEVMSHIRAYANQCPKAAPIIHLGATSAFILDNCDLILMKQASLEIQKSLKTILLLLRDLALKYKSTRMTGYTHYQIAQPTSLGKRFALWLQDFLDDYKQLENQVQNLPFRGVKGTTGTQDSFLKLFDQNHEKVFHLDELLSDHFSFKKKVLLTGQTYSRKIDFYFLNTLSGIAQTAHKLTNDFRLLNHSRLLEESFSDKQVGSSAMPYKKNPIIAERIAGLSRYLMNQVTNSSLNYSLQWFERTLDDSSNRRILIPESFLLADYILKLLIQLFSKMKINLNLIEKDYQKNLPFFMTEEILMKSVLAGGNRQKIHEAIRQASLITYQKMIEGENSSNELYRQLSLSSEIPFSEKQLNEMALQSSLIGCVEKQILSFIENELDPLI